MTAPEGDLPPLVPISWCEAEPERLRRDCREIEQQFPGLAFIDPGGSHDDLTLPDGGWYGVLPIWPFERPQPTGVDELVAGQGLEMVLEYPAAYPMIAPTIHPLSPEPAFEERTQATWHVLPGGGLCLLQSAGGWIPEASVTELLLKAAGWRIEYALMKTGALEKMSVAGIVSDPTLDAVIGPAAAGEDVLSAQRT